MLIYQEGTFNMAILGTGWGPQSIAWTVAWTKWLNAMVYGRYNELVNGGYIGL